MENEVSKRVASIIEELARREGKRPAEVRRSMQEAIDDAWDRSRVDPKLRRIWNSYFPSGQKPILEELIQSIGDLVAAGIWPS